MNNKIKVRVIFIIGITSIVFLTIVFWNKLPESEKHGMFFPLLFLSIALVSVCWLYVVYLKETNEAIISEVINKKVEEERSKILAEFNKKEEVIEEVKVDVDELITKIIPKGNFKNLESFVTKFLQNLAPEIEMSQGLFYLLNKDEGVFEYLKGYGVTKDEIASFKAGENLTGQVALTKEIMVIHDLPDDYISVESGLGKSKAVRLVIIPFVSEDETFAILEIATFKSKTEKIEDLINRLMNQASEKLVQMLKS